MAAKPKAERIEDGRKLLEELDMEVKTVSFDVGDRTGSRVCGIGPKSENAHVTPSFEGEDVALAWAGTRDGVRELKRLAEEVANEPTGPKA